jgi:hypothetical protein
MAKRGDLFLIHWNAGEVEALAEPLRAAWRKVEIEAEDGQRARERMKSSPPAAPVIYLDRLPSHGRETARAIGASKAGRDLPILFVDGTHNQDERRTFRI